jgi:hypothetical protein
MDDSTVVLTLPVLDQDVQLGMLYDVRTAQFFSGVSLWNNDVVNAKQTLDDHEVQNAEFTCSYSLDEARNHVALDVEGSLSLDLGIIKAIGSAKYLSNKKSSTFEVYAYQQKVGSLQYAATITRPDIARTTSKLSEFLQNPSPQHQGAVNQALAYLQKTRTLAIEYSAETNNQQVFVCASDAAFADDTATRRSTEGYLFKLFGGAIDWYSTKQKTITTSSTEAELRALVHAAKETFWWNASSNL